MVIVIGSVLVNAGSQERALEICQAHVMRSRSEPGCISHAVHIDSENPQRLVFVERWEDYAALQTHFRVPESGDFVQELGKLAAEAPEMSIYEAEAIGPAS